MMQPLPGYDNWLTHDPNDRIAYCVCGHERDDHSEHEPEGLGGRLYATLRCWIAGCKCDGYEEREE